MPGCRLQVVAAILHKEVPAQLTAWHYLTQLLQVGVYLVKISLEPRSEASMISQGPQGCLAQASFVQATTDHQAVNSESSCVSTQLWNLN